MNRQDNELLPKASAELRRYEGLFKRAQVEAEEAEQALMDARSRLAVAEGAFMAAQQIFGAALVDRKALINLDGLSERKVAWLKALLAFDVFSLADASRAAEDSGWRANPATIRQEIGRVREKGLVIRLNQGAFRLATDARRLLSASSGPVEDRYNTNLIDTEPGSDLSGLDDQVSGSNPEEDDLFASPTTEYREEADSPARHPTSEMNEEDDDLPF